MTPNSTSNPSARKPSINKLSRRRKSVIGAACALLLTGAVALAVLCPIAPTQAAGRPVAASVAEVPNTAPTQNHPPKMTKVVSSAAPTWSELSAVQKHVLEPLASDWDKLKPTTRKKWLEISNRYASMTPAEQERLQARMRGWVTLTPEQRRIARENYARANKLDTEQRALRWQQYQQLSEQQKEELAEQATPRHKRVTTLPPATLNKSKPAAPAKLAPAAGQEQTAVVAPAPAPGPVTAPAPDASPDAGANREINILNPAATDQLASQQPTPSLKRRFGSIMYEAMLLFGILFISGWIFSTLLQQRNALYLRHGQQAWLFIVLTLYFVWCWSHGGQTLAMKTWRIQLVNRDGSAVRAGRAAIRFLLSWCWFLPGLALAWALGAHTWMLVLIPAANFVLWAMTIYLDPQRQFLHDRIAGTRLVNMAEIVKPAGKHKWYH